MLASLQAIENGAAAVVTEADVEGLSQDVPVIKTTDAADALRRFAVSFYNHPSRKMLMVGVTGSFCSSPSSSDVACKENAFEDAALVPAS